MKGGNSGIRGPGPGSAAAGKAEKSTNTSQWVGTVAGGGGSSCPMAVIFTVRQEAGPLLRLQWEDRKGKSAGED